MIKKLLISLTLVSSCAMAQMSNLPQDKAQYQLSGGITLFRGPGPVMDLSFTTPSKLVSENAYWQGSMTVVGSSSNRGIDAPTNYIVRGLYVQGFGHIYIGAGGSWMSDPYPYNGSNLNFALQGGYQFRAIPLTITYLHFSNAGLTPQNLGRDMIVAGWRFH